VLYKSIIIIIIIINYEKKDMVKKGTNCYKMNMHV